MTREYPTMGSLFSGIGGLDLGMEWAGWNTQWQVENDPFCNTILARHWPRTHRYSDIRTLSGEELPYVDLITGGFPCQPFSHAGRRTAEDDDRYLWPHMLRIIREVRPQFVVAENVYGLVTIKEGLVLETVYLDLEAEGYEVAPPIVFPAAAVGALHRRDRTWICAHTRSHAGRPEQRVTQEGPKDYAAVFEDAADAAFSRMERLRAGRFPQLRTLEEAFLSIRVGDREWEVEPDIRRADDGIPHRVDRLKTLGNAVVPQCAEVIGEIILQLWKEGIK